MILFNGTEHAQEMFKTIAQYAQQYAAQHQPIKIASILFKEDAGSQLYACIKQEQARLLNIEYELHTFSLADNLEGVLRVISQLNTDSTITGIIIQKPWRKTWESFANGGQRDMTYETWWSTLYSAVDPEKDVDGLHPETIAAIKDDTWEQKGKVLPATCKAVLYILKVANGQRPMAKVVIIGKSDLLGIPLFHVLKNIGFDVELLGKKDLDKRVETGQKLLDAQVIVSATGVQHLITGEMIAQDVILIDVGEPKPDIDVESVATKASFLTPVPGGVGPLTVACLMQNAVFLSMRKLRDPQTF